MIELRAAHVAKFGAEPIIIGINWSNTEKVYKGIEKAIKSGEPYDETKQLSKKDLSSYQKGELLF